jgi:putative SOS response-associated peptidase YedK
MCGRFTLHTSPEVLADLFGLDAAPELAPRYNIAPTQPVAIVRPDKSGEQREWTLVHWGLIPSWSKDPSIGARMINARAESVEEKPSFRAAFRRRRCLIPADGFYEWQKRASGKQPFYFQVDGGSPFAFAGLWEFWAGPDGSEIESCTILTTDPNELTSKVHNRMPVILSPEDYDDWLMAGEADRTNISLLKHLLRPFDAKRMSAHPVSTYVNSPFHEGAECIQPVSES